MRTNRTDAFRNVRHSAVVQIIARDHRQHGELETHPRDRFSHSLRLVRIGIEGLARVDETESARSRAAIAEHHERRRAIAPALAQVWTSCLLAHGDEIQVAQRALGGENLLGVVDLRSDPLRLARAD